MDNALCGGAGATLTGAALEAVKAAIFMGDPHYRAGQPYNVGTCTAQGVSTDLPVWELHNNQTNSSLLARLASSARQRRRTGSSHTATLPTRTAALETTQTPTSNTSTSTVLRL
jgi:hypothetical protein